MKLDVKDYTELPVTLTVEQVAGVLGIGRVQAYNLVRTESFPKIIVGRRIVIPKQAFINWLDSQATALTQKGGKGSVKENYESYS